MLNELVTSERATELLEIASQSAMTMKILANATVDMFKIKSKTLQLNPAKVSLYKVL